MMKKTLPLISLLLVSCVGSIYIATNEKEPEEIYYNVNYRFNYDDFNYDVYVIKGTEYTEYKVEIKNFYNVLVNDYAYYTIEDEDCVVVERGTMENKFYVKTSELFVFTKK